MKNFKEIWKNKAQTKTITTQDMVAYGVLRAIAAKGENKEDIAWNLVGRAFTKSKHHDYLKLETAIKNVASSIKWNKKLLGVAIEDIFDSDEEFDLFNNLIEYLKKANFDRHYTYVFVRQDFAPEYQLVQAAHATMVLGKNLKNGHCPTNTYFAVCGANDLEDLNNITEHLKANNYEYELFVEPDIGNEVTAVATQPIDFRLRKPLKKFRKLTFSVDIE